MKTFVARALPALLLAVLALPVITLAADAPDFVGGEFGNFFTNVVSFMNGVLVPFVFALAFLVFIWGMFKAFILGGSDEAKQSEGKALMFYAIIGFVVMVSLWGIVNLVAEGFGLSGEGVQDIPNLPPAR
jgi:hypothetical protein